MVNRNFTNISCKALGQLISLTDSSSRKVAKNSVYDKEHVYYLPAIRLFILLNFKVYTKDGSVSGLYMKELEEEIGCCHKTLLSSLEKLSSGERPLISYEIDEETKLLSVSILNYKEMFKRSGEGGLRYLVFSNKLFNEILKINNINEMRLFIRALIECEEEGGREASLSLKQMLAGLPAYLRPCNVRNFLTKYKDLLVYTPNANHSMYHLELGFFSDSKKLRNKMLEINENLVRSLINDFNNKIISINTYHYLSDKDTESKINAEVSSDVKSSLKVNLDWRKARADKIKALPLFNFKTKDYEQVALIATQLDFDTVKGALIKYMEEFVLTGRGSTRMDVIQNIAEKIFKKTKNFFSNNISFEDADTFDNSELQLAT